MECNSNFVLRHPQSEQAFKEGVCSVFRQWTALELAIDQRWGGIHSAEKGDILIQKVLDLFIGRNDSKKVYPDVRFSKII